MTEATTTAPTRTPVEKLSDEVQDMILGLGDPTQLVEGFAEGVSAAKELDAFGAGDIMESDRTSETRRTSDNRLGYLLGVYVQRTQEGTL